MFATVLVLILVPTFYRIYAKLTPAQMMKSDITLSFASPRKYRRKLYSAKGRRHTARLWAVRWWAAALVALTIVGERRVVGGGLRYGLTRVILPITLSACFLLVGIHMYLPEVAVDVTRRTISF